MQTTPILHRIADAIAQRLLGAVERDDQHIIRDPLSHPALQTMSQTSLADLPFEPFALTDQAAVRTSAKATASRSAMPPSSACLSGSCPL